MKRKILIVSGRYLPGYKDGGPVRTIKNITDRLGDEYQFYILTTDRDHGDQRAYDNIVRNDWNQVGKAQVYYVQPGGFDQKTVLACATIADLVYVCGCFNDYARVILRLKKENQIQVPVVIASMGLFSPGAFRIKYLKKKSYMTVLKALGWFRNITWSATSAEEAADIRHIVGSAVNCVLAEDLPRIPQAVSHGSVSKKGELRIVFLSRISRKKNLAYAAKILQRVQNGTIHLDIYGNQEDPDYWEECLLELRKLPLNITWEYLGEADAEAVPQIFAKYDLFLFPTCAENYGHVILEAMSGGCIPLISDKTPWTEEKMNHHGVVCELGTVNNEASLQNFADQIQRFVAMDMDDKRSYIEACMAFAKAYDPVDAENAYRRIFDGEIV